MKKYLHFPLLAAFSLLLCAFSVSPAPGSDTKPSMKIEMTTVIAAGGSGTLEYKVTLSKELMDLLKTASEFDEATACESFFQYGYSGWDQSQNSYNGALACSAENKFEDLDGLESMIESDFSGSSFERLEIKDGTLYYDLKPNINGSDYTGQLGSELPFEMEGSWILEVPGEVVSTNADNTSGRTLTWDMMALSSSSHIKAESKLSGGGVFGSDSTLMVVAAILLMGCCCVVVLVGGGAAFFFLRRKKAAPAA